MSSASSLAGDEGALTDRDTDDLWIDGRAAAATTDDLLTVDKPCDG